MEMEKLVKTSLSICCSGRINNEFHKNVLNSTIIIMNRTFFTAKEYYPCLLNHIKRICAENNVDDTHGLAHSVKIGKLTEEALHS